MSVWRRKCVLEFSVISLLILAGCSTTTGSVATSPPVPNEACLEFKPIQWAKADMVIKPDNQTMVQIREHNAVWKRLCGS